MPSRDPLEVGSFAISTGAESIGLPMARSRETVLDHYVALLARLRPTAVREPRFRDEDIDRLASATGLEPGVVRRRLASLVSALQRRD